MRILLLLLLLFSAQAPAYYNLSASWKKITALTKTWIGNTRVTKAWQTSYIPITGTGNGMFTGPWATAIDLTNGFLFVADTSNNRIQKFNLTTGAFIGWLGAIGTTGGTCTAGVGLFTGGWCSGGTPTSGTGDGMFNGPSGIQLDVPGDLMYVADASNNRVQKFTLSTGAFLGWIGKIGTTGGTCTAGVGLFTGGWCSGGTSTSGTGDGMINGVGSIAIDVANNNLYVSDYTNHRVQKFTLSTGAFVGWIGKIATTGGTCMAGAGLFTGGWCNGGTAGSGTGGGMFNSPRGIAINTATNNLYVVDRFNHRVEKFTLSTGAFVGWIGKIATTGGTCTAGVNLFTGGWCSGGTAGSGTGGGMFNLPYGVSLESTGNILYVTDGNNNRMQKFTLSTGAFVGWFGKITTTGGTCTAGAGLFSGGWCSGGVAGSGSGDGMLSGPFGVTSDTSNNIMYVSDTSNNRIQKYTLSTGAVLSSLGTAIGPQSTWSNGTAVTSSGNLDGTFNQPWGIAIDNTNGYLYIADISNSRIQKFNLSTGAFVGWIGKIATTGGTCTAGVGNFTGGWCSGGTSTPGSDGDGKMTSPYNVTIDVSNNNLYVVDTFANRIQKFNLATGAFIGWIGKIATAGGTCTAGVGNFTGGWCSGGTSGSGANDGMLSNPTDAAVDATNNALYVVDSGNHRVQKYNLSTGAFVGWMGAIGTTGGTCTAGVGQFTGGWCSGGTSASGTGDGMFIGPIGIAIDRVKNVLLVSDSTNDRIEKFNLSTGAFVGWIGMIDTVGGTCTAGVGVSTGKWCSGGTSNSGSGDGMFNGPYGIAIDASHNYFYVADAINYRIQKFTLGMGEFVGWIGGIGSTGGGCTAGVGQFTGGFCSGGTGASGTGDGLFNTPNGIAIDSGNQYLYASDYFNHRVYRFTPP